MTPTQSPTETPPRPGREATPPVPGPEPLSGIADPGDDPQTAPEPEKEPAESTDEPTGTFLVFEGPAFDGPWEKIGFVTDQANARVALVAFFEPEDAPPYRSDRLYVATSARGFRPRYLKPNPGFTISDAKPEPDTTGPEPA